jgi:hypothetical protein
VKAAQAGSAGAVRPRPDLPDAGQRAYRSPEPHLRCGQKARAMSPKSVLKTFPIERGTALVQAVLPSSRSVSLESPAIEVMTDLSHVKAASIAPSAPLKQAELTMIHQGVRMLFVVTELPSVEGLITYSDLHGARQMRAANDRHVRWDELCVADAMTELAALHAINFDDLRTATVANLIATLQRFGRNHLLVMQPPATGAPACVRGVISRTQIERQLGQPVQVTEIASSFAEIERALI